MTRSATSGKRKRQRVARLVQAELATARHLQTDEPSEARLRDGAVEFDALCAELVDRLLQVVTQEIQFMPAAALGLDRVDAELAGWQLEDQPAGVRIDVREAKHVAKKRAS